MKNLTLPVIDTKTAYELGLSKDLKYLANITNSALVIYDTNSGKERVQFKDFKHPSHIAFANKSELIALKTTSGKIGIYDLVDNKLIRNYTPTKKEGCNLFFSPDDHFIIDADWNGNIILIDVRGSINCIVKKYETYMVTSITNTKNKYLFIISPIATPETGKIDRNVILLEWEYPFETNKPSEYIIPYNSLDIARYSHTSDVIAMAYSKHLVIFDMKNQIPVKKLEFENYIKHLAWTNDDQYLGVVSGDKIQFFNSADFSIRKEIEMEYACFVDFSEDDKYILLGSWKKGRLLPMVEFLNE